MSDFMEQRKALAQAVNRTVQRYMEEQRVTLPRWVAELYADTKTQIQRIRVMPPRSAAELYDYAAMKIPPKNSYRNYHWDIIKSIMKNAIQLEYAYNQETKKTSKLVTIMTHWLEAKSDAGWVHFFPIPRINLLAYRCYICCSLSHTGEMLNLLFDTFKRKNMSIPYFKVAAHDEAMHRNDTIVAWFPDKNTAKIWADTALASPDIWREGDAPPGLVNLQNTVSIDKERPGTTTTSLVAQRAYDNLQKYWPY